MLRYPLYFLILMLHSYSMHDIYLTKAQRSILATWIGFDPDLHITIETADTTVIFVFSLQCAMK